MNLKLLAIVIILIMAGSIFASAVDTASVNITNDIETRLVRVAILAEHPTGWGSAEPVFVQLLDNYQWTAGNKSYKFVVTEIFDKDILKGNLNTDNYDILVVPGGGVGDGEALTKGYPLLPKIKLWKNEIADFIKNGGGYTGYCGGTALIAELEKTPESFLERQYEKSAFGVSSVKIFFKDVADPLLSQLVGKPPEKMGVAAYAWVPQDDFDLDDADEFNKAMDSLYSGVPLDMSILNNHPIFDDVLQDTRRVSWIGGPALILPDDSTKDVTVLACYPTEEMSENESTRIYAWEYTGGVIGLLKALPKGIKLCREFNDPLRFAPTYAYFEARDWEPTNKIIEMNFSNKPCMTAEIYPNEKEGRIILCGLHPEYPIWWGGHLESIENTNENCLGNGLYIWKDTIPKNETIEDENTYNWWIVRRQVAWAAKIPDNDLPPVYGPSQVCDIEPYNQSSNFTILGNSESSDGLVSLNLYYRYSEGNSSWDNWTLFDADTNEDNGWSWEFNLLNGPGYYQFYSIRNVEYEGYTETEKAPPGPDASVHVIED